MHAPIRQNSASINKSLSVAVGLLLLLTACSTARRDLLAPAPGTVLKISIADVFADYYEDRLRLYPMEATFAGDNRYNDSLPNILTDSYRSQV